MKILFLTNNPNLGSTARILQIWCEELPKHGHSVQVVCPPGSLADMLRERGVPFRLSTLPWFDWKRPWHAAAEAARVAWWARGVDVVHCNEHNVYPFGAFVARFLRRPAVCHVRFELGADFARWAFGRFGSPAALLWTSYDQAERCTPSVEALIPAERRHVLRLGLDLREFSPAGEAKRKSIREEIGIAPDAIVLGTVSAFKPIKRIEDFVEVVHRVRERHPEVIGLVVGGAFPGLESYWSQIGSLIEKYDGACWLLRTGHTDNVASYVQSMNIFISTSELETFGNSVCEAMACGKVVVGYRGGSVSEVVGETGRIVENLDLDGCVREVLELLEKPNQLEGLGKLARQRVCSEFEATSRIPELLKIYEAVV